MCVTLPIGIALRTTACCSIADALAAICAGVSNAIPCGGEEKPACAGCIEWQTAQRSATMARTRENGTRGPADELSGGRIQIAMPASAIAAATGIAQTLRPWWRRLKKCRIAAPITIRQKRTSQAWACVYVNAKWLESIANNTGSVR